MRRARLLLTALSLGSSVLSFLSYTLLLRQLGASAQVDALFYSASVPVGLAGLLGAVLVYLLPTRLTELAAAEQSSALRALARWVRNFTLLALAGCLAWACLQGLEGLQGLHPLTGANAMLGGFIVLGGITVVCTLFVCQAQAQGLYLVAGLNQFLQVLGLAAGVAVAVVTAQVAWVVWGQLIGAAAAGLVLAHRMRSPTLPSLAQPPGSRGDGQALRTLLGPLRPHLLHIVAASTAFTLFQPIDAYLCRMLGEGAVSTMAFAQRAWVAAGILISLGAHTIVARTSRDAFDRGGAQALQLMARREIARILAAGVVVGVGYLLVGRSLLRLLLEANVMPVGDLQRLLDCIGWMLVSAPAMAAIPYIFRVLYTLNNYRTAAYIGAAVPVIYGSLAWLALPSLDLMALPAALGVAWWLALAAAMLTLHSHARPAAGDKQA